MSGNEKRFVDEAFDTNWVVPLGPNVNAFEDELKSFALSMHNAECTMENGITVWPELQPMPEDLATKEVVALSSGTAALHLALVALGVKAGDEVMCQSFTFCASCYPIAYLGATPVLVDSEPETWNMDPELLDVAIQDRIDKTGRKPKAIVVVDLFGMPAKMDEIGAVAAKYDIPIVEDAAEALGSRYNGQMCGTFGEFGVWSFNGNKMITTSGGGALICHDMEARQKVMFYATQARESYPYYQHEEIGYNYRMSNICAGIGRGQLTILDEHIAHHRMLAEVYEEGFEDVEGIEFHGNPAPQPPKGGVVKSNFWLSTITLDPELKIKGDESVVTGEGRPNANVEAVRQALERENIETRPLWKPMHLQPVFRGAPAYVNGVSERLFKVGLCLPSGPWVSVEDAHRIIRLIKSLNC